MKLKATIAAIALTLAPTFAVAMGGCGMETSASQCGVGQVWDQTTNSCVTPVTG